MSIFKMIWKKLFELWDCIMSTVQYGENLHFKYIDIQPMKVSLSFY